MTDTLKIVSPVDGRVYAERSTAGDAEIEKAVTAARAAQAEWARTPIAERGRFCLAFLDAMLAMKEDMVPELAWQMGRPVRYGGEFAPFEERVRYMVEIAEAALRPVVPAPRQGFTRYVAREPLGIVLVIAPWNYPFITAVNVVVPALMAGSAVLLKHSTQTLLVGERFQQAFERAGLPKDLFRNLVLSHGQTEALIAGGHVDHVNFTGSVEGGRTIERAAAGTFTTLGLELGGKDPAYVLPDADIDHAVANLVDGAFYNSGQCCCGIERIYVHESVYRPFVDGFVEMTRQYVLGDPLDPETTLGPMARGQTAEFVRGQIDAALRAGATAHIDWRAFPRNEAGSPYLAPQVLTEVNHQMSVMTEESFGPVVGIMKVHDDDEAITLMNDSSFGLTASIWTADADRAEAIGQRVETGTVFMNRCDYVDPGLVWTGVKDTGRGASLSSIGYEHLTRPKSFHLRTAI